LMHKGFASNSCSWNKRASQGVPSACVVFITALLLRHGACQRHICAVELDAAAWLLCGCRALSDFMYLQTHTADHFSHQGPGDEVERPPPANQQRTRGFWMRLRAARITPCLRACTYAQRGVCGNVATRCGLLPSPR
jgi:hypothetical protein